MSRLDFIMAVMSRARTRRYSPCQVQKLLFLLDRRLIDRLGGPLFNFKPEAYGPLDLSIYDDLRSLEGQEYVEIDDRQFGVSSYRLTDEGVDKGVEEFNKLSGDVRDYLEVMVSFVRSLSFTELVAAVCKEYPEMKENLVFSPGT